MARRYEFYVRVARKISHEWAQQMSGILFLQREHKVHIFEPTCNVLFIINILMTAFFTIFRRFSKMFQRPDEHSRTFSENFRKFPKISKEFRRFPKTIEEDPKMFRWHNNLDISEINENFTCEDIVSFLLICYHLVYHWLLYNKNNYFIFIWLVVWILQYRSLW